jgi:uncharacterized protein (TIGR02466 family)
MTADANGAGGQQGRLNRELYFPTFIFFKDLPDGASLNAGLCEEIYAMRENDRDGLHRSNVKQAGAWHSRDDLNRQDAFKHLVAEVVTAAQGVFDDLRYDPAFEPQIDNMWANISPQHAFNRMHTHPGVIWSGVYYVQTPKNAGRIYFSDPRVQAQVLRPRVNEAGRKEPHNWSEVYYEPIAGRLILFPAWLLHEVEPNLSDLSGPSGDRISISFNLVQRRKTEEPTHSGADETPGLT